MRPHILHWSIETTCLQKKLIDSINRTPTVCIKLPIFSETLFLFLNTPRENLASRTLHAQSCSRGYKAVAHAQTIFPPVPDGDNGRSEFYAELFCEGKFLGERYVNVVGKLLIYHKRTTIISCLLVQSSVPNE